MAQGSIRFAYILVYLTLLLIGLLPIWSLEYLPLQDYPNHLSRMHIINNLNSDPFLSRYYSICFHSVPNLAMDLIVPLLNQVFDIDTSARIFISISILLISTGCIALRYLIFRKFDPFVFVIFTLLLSQVLIKGFLNYYFGIGLMFWGVALWIYHKDSTIHLRAFIALISVFCIYFSHLAALGLFVCIVKIIEIQALRSKEKIDLLHYIPLSIVLLFPIILYKLGPTSNVSLSVRYQTVYIKFIFNLLHLTDIQNLSINKLFLLFFLGTYTTGLLTKKIQIPHPFQAILLILYILYLIMPYSIITSANADWRLLLPIALLLVCTSNIRNISKPIKHTIIGVFLLLYIAQTTLLLQRWGQNQSTLAAAEKAIQQIPRGSKLYSLFFFNNHRLEGNRLMHYPASAVISRSAFIPSLFAYASQQPLSYNEKYKKLRLTKVRFQIPEEPTPKLWSRLLSSADYLLVYRSKDSKTLPRNKLTQAYQEGPISLWKVKKAK